MKNKLLYSTAIVLTFTCLAGTANAFDWTGFQIGLEGGYSKGSAKNVDTIKEEKLIPEGKNFLSAIGCNGVCPTIPGNQPNYGDAANLPSFNVGLPSWPDANIVGNQPGIDVGNQPGNNHEIGNLPSINPSLPNWPTINHPILPEWPSANNKVTTYSTRELKSYQEGLIGGIYAGYNYQFESNVVIGVVGDFIIGDMKSEQDSTFKSEVSDINTNFSVSKKYNANALLKAGYAFDNILLYVSAGVSYAKFDIGKSDTFKVDDAVKSIQNFYNDGKAGYVVGAGIDYALTDNVITKFEYRHSDYGKVDIGLGNETKIKSDDFIIGVAYKF